MTTSIITLQVAAVLGCRTGQNAASSHSFSIVVFCSMGKETPPKKASSKKPLSSSEKKRRQSDSRKKYRLRQLDICSENHFRAAPSRIKRQKRLIAHAIAQKRYRTNEKTEKAGVPAMSQTPISSKQHGDESVDDPPDPVATPVSLV